MTEQAYTGNPLLFSFVEIKKGPESDLPAHAPYKEVNSTWWNYITTTYLNTGKLLEMSNTTSSNSVIRVLFFKFNTLADRTEFFTDAQVLGGFDELSAYNNEVGTFKLIQVDEDRSYPLKGAPFLFPFSQYVNAAHTFPANPVEIGGIVTISGGVGVNRISA